MGSALAPSATQASAIIAIIAAFWSASPGLAEGMPPDIEEIGMFSVTINDNQSDFISVASEAAGFSSLVLTRGAGGLKDYRISGVQSLNNQIPLLDVGLQEGGLVNGLGIVSVTLMDKDYDTALAAFYGDYGKITYTDVEVDDAGQVSFSFSADLIRINLAEETAIDGQPGAHIEGTFSGTIPARELVP